MDQQHFEFDEDAKKGFSPSKTKDIFLTKEQHKRSRATKILLYLKEAGEPFTKREIAMTLYPKAFNKDSRDSPQFFYDGYRQRNPVADAEQDYIDRAGEVIRSHNSAIRKQFREIEKSHGHEQALTWLRDHAQIIVPVSKIDSGSWCYAYHGPERPCSKEDLMSFYELALEHKDNQDLYLTLAERIMTANGLPIRSGSATQKPRQIDLMKPASDDEIHINDLGPEQSSI